MISDKFKKGDVTEYTMPMDLHKKVMSDDQNKIVMLYGSVVLEGELDENGMKAREIPVLVTKY